MAESGMTEEDREVVMAIGALAVGNMRLTMSVAKALTQRLQAEQKVLDMSESLDSLHDVAAADQLRAQLDATRRQSFQKLESTILDAIAACEAEHQQAVEGLKHLRRIWGM